MDNGCELPDGWRLADEEVPNGAHWMRLTWERGPFVEPSGTDFEGLRAWCTAAAQDTEDQLRQKGFTT